MAANLARLVLGRGHQHVLVSSRRLRSTSSVVRASLDEPSRPATRVSVLDNGLTVATDSEISHESGTSAVNVIISAGPKHEVDELNGATNLMDHMLLSSKSNTNDLKGIGGRIHSRVERDKLVIEASCLSGNVDKLVAILANMINKPEYGNLEECKGQVLKEINDAQNDVQQVTMDLLHSVAFQQTPLERTPLGNTSSIQKLSEDGLKGFWNAQLQGSNVIISAAGNVDHERVTDAVNNHFAVLPATLQRTNLPLDSPIRYSGSDVRYRDDSMPLCSVALAVEGCGQQDDDNLALEAALRLLGNWDRSHVAGLNNSNRLASYCHKLNICHHYQTFNLNYKTTGLWGVYFVGDRMKLELMAHNVMEEWKRLCISISDFELARAKNNLKFERRTLLSGPLGVARDVGQQMFGLGRRMAIEDYEAAVDRLTSTEVQDACWKFIYDRCLVVSAYGPCENLPEYIRLRSNMYWLRL